MKKINLKTLNKDECLKKQFFLFDLGIGKIFISCINKPNKRLKNNYGVEDTAITSRRTEARDFCTCDNEKYT